MKKSAIIGLILLGVAVVLGMQDRAHFLQAYLVAFLFWMALPLGAMGLRMIHHLTGGGWGRAIAVYLDASVRTVPLLVIFFIPLALGVKELFPWAHGHHHFTGFKAQYLTVNGFYLRAAICFIVWVVTSMVLTAWSHEARKQEEAPSGLQGFSGIGLLLYVLTMTLAATDWAMSLEPEWFSTIYGALFMVGNGLEMFSFSILVMAFCQKPADKPEQTPGRIHDLGNLMLAFTMLWAYMTLSQFLIIWSGNLPEEAFWYINRSNGGWKVVGLLTVGFQFIVPFFLLLIRSWKRDPKTLWPIAAIIFAAKFIELTWIIKPSFSKTFYFNPMDILIWLGMGGVWLAVFCWQREAVERHS